MRSDLLPLRLLLVAENRVLEEQIDGRGMRLTDGRSVSARSL